MVRWCQKSLESAWLNTARYYQRLHYNFHYWPYVSSTYQQLNCHVSDCSWFPVLQRIIFRQKLQPLSCFAFLEFVAQFFLLCCIKASLSSFNKHSLSVSSSSRYSRYSICLPYAFVTRSFPRAKRLGHGFDNRTPSSVKVEDRKSYTSSPALGLRGLF